MTYRLVAIWILFNQPFYFQTVYFLSNLLYQKDSIIKLEKSFMFIYLFLSITLILNSYFKKNIQIEVTRTICEFD